MIHLCNPSFGYLSTFKFLIKNPSSLALAKKNYFLKKFISFFINSIKKIDDTIV
jgi:hypothetical protein